MDERLQEELAMMDMEKNSKISCGYRPYGRDRQWR
jgi:hypothetical protein